MEEIEVPTEAVQESIHHHAEHNRDRQSMAVAITSAFLAALAAVAALLSGHHANEAMLKQIEAANSWNYYQAKGIKAAILSSKMELSKSASEADTEKLESYKKEQEQIHERAEHAEKESGGHLSIHEILARSVTLFQIAITISAISLLTRKKVFWWLSLGFGVLGLWFFVQGLITHLPHS